MADVPTFFFSHARQDRETPGNYLRCFFDDLEIKLAQWAAINLEERRLGTIDARVPQGDDWDEKLSGALRQSIDGVTAILRSIRAFRSPTVNGAAIEFFPVATRIENAEQPRLEVARKYARAKLAEFLPTEMGSRHREYWDRMEIAYRPAYAFEEILAAYGDATGALGAADTMASQMEAMAQQIGRDPALRVPEILETDRADVLKRYAFGGQAIPVATAPPTEGDATDRDFLRGVLAKEQMWRRSGFPWQLLLSPRELGLLTEADRKGFGRNVAFYLVQSERMQRLSRTLGVGGPITPVLALVGVLIVYLLAFNFNILHVLLDPGGGIAFALFTFGTWMFFAFIWSVATTARDRPHGFRIWSAFPLTLLGPFSRGIRDYDAIRPR